MIDLETLLQLVKTTEGVELDKLDAGTELIIKTHNSTYNIEVVDKRRVLIQGGSLKHGGIRYPVPTNVVIAGSTWGGSVIKLGFIGEQMQMEIYEEKRKHLTTSRVKAAKLRTDKGYVCLWGDDMNWRIEGF